MKLRCGKCNKLLSAPDSAVGKIAPCPQCGTSIRIPAPAKKPGPAKPSPTVMADWEPRSPDPSEQLDVSFLDGAKHAPALDKGGTVKPSSTPPPMPARISQAPESQVAVGVQQAAGDVADGDVYPWDPRPELLAKVEQYTVQGQVQTVRCGCLQFLTRVTKDEVLGAVAKGEFHVYPDVVGVDGRPISGCLLLLLTLPGLILAGPVAFLLAIPFYLLRVLLLPLDFLLVYLAKFWYDMIARRIRANPKSKYAIRKLFDLTDFMPRYWGRGDVVQLIRAEVPRFLCGSRSVLLIVQDNQLPKRQGFLELFLGQFPILMCRRRIYMVHFEDGEAVADQAARDASKALNVGVTEGKFRGPKFVLA